MGSVVHAVVDSVIHLPKGQAHPKAIERLRREMSFPNPDYVSRVRFGRWIGAVPEEIVLLEERDSEWLLPRGAVGPLRQALGSCGQGIEFRDGRTTQTPVEFAFSSGLRDYQAQAARELVRRVQGCIVVPCGGGKTRCAIGAIARARQPAIVLVHTRALLDQWREALAAAFGAEAGVVAESVVRPGPVTVASIQTLAMMDPAALAELGRGFGVVVLDECHHAPAATFRSVLPAFPGRYRFGLTATPDRADGLTPLLSLCIGPVVFEVGHRELVERGYLVLPRVEVVRTGCTPGEVGYAKTVDTLVADRRRNELIVEIVRREAAEGRRVLVLSGRVKHCQVLARLLEQAGVRSAALTAGASAKRRVDMLARFQSGDLAVLCATSLADEGLDVASLSRLVLSTPAKAAGRTIQRLGRLMRPHPGKDTPVLFDLVDEGPLAQRQHLARQRAYRRVLDSDGCAHG